MNARDQLARMLTHYIRTGWEAAGLGWDSDNTAEMEATADLVVAVVQEEVRAELKARRGGETL